MEGINVLSLFDGMSCGQIALKKLGMQVDNYFAAEIDKFAIQQIQHNFPNTIQLGSVIDVKAKDLPRIDLLIGGSPCQGFSFAGKQLNFNDERSKLFFEFVRLKNELKPKYFLLENVNMKKEYLRIISEYLGLFPVRLNSNKISGANRDRWYWTNIKTKEVGLFAELWTDIPNLKDKGIYLCDVLEKEVDEKYIIKSDISKRLEFNYKVHSYPYRNKANCLVATDYKLTHNIIKLSDGRIRRTTPNEHAKLQTIPDWYEWIVSNTQAYKMLGNGWTVDVIAHIFGFIH